MEGKRKASSRGSQTTKKPRVHWDSVPDQDNGQSSSSQSNVNIGNTTISLSQSGQASARTSVAASSSRGSEKTKKPRVHWDSVPDQDNGQSSSSRPNINVRNTSISLSQSGQVSSRTSYVSVAASPKKATPASTEPLDPIVWNDKPVTDEGDWVEEAWVDPEYIEHVHTVNVFPKKRKRTNRVHFHHHCSSVVSNSFFEG
jgi:hypothetical protein